MNMPGPDMTAEPGSASKHDHVDWSVALMENQRWLKSVLRSRINDLHVVDDLFQEVSLAVFRQNSRPVDPQKVAPWLYRLAIRYAINFHRKSGRRKRLNERLQNSALSGTTNLDGDDALHWLIQNEQQQLIKRAMQSLRGQDREILNLKYTENWTYKQLAEHLGANLGTIEYRLLRAKKRLRSTLISLSMNEVVS